MPGDTSEFATACKQAARDLRRIPKELRREVGAEVKKDVADPLAAAIRQAWHGPQAAVLSAATKTRVNVDPVIVVGGSRRVLSGGGSARDVVFGNEFGGGKRSALVNRPRSAGRKRRGRVTTTEAATTRKKIFRRHTTKQFPVEGQHAVFGTVEDLLDDTFARWVDVIDRLIVKGFNSGS